MLKKPCMFQMVAKWRSFKEPSSKPTKSPTNRMPGLATWSVGEAPFWGASPVSFWKDVVSWKQFSGASPFFFKGFASWTPNGKNTHSPNLRHAHMGPVGLGASWLTPPEMKPAWPSQNPPKDAQAFGFSLWNTAGPWETNTSVIQPNGPNPKDCRFPGKGGDSNLYHRSGDQL